MINGCLAAAECVGYAPSMSVLECMSVYCRNYPAVGVQLQGNYHGMDTPTSDLINRSDTADIGFALLFNHFA